MRQPRAIDGLRGSSEPLSSAFERNDSHEITYVCTNDRSIAQDAVTDPSAGLAPRLRGEGVPANDGPWCPSKAPRPAGTRAERLQQIDALIDGTLVESLALLERHRPSVITDHITAARNALAVAHERGPKGVFE